MGKVLKTNIDFPQRDFEVQYYLINICLGMNKEQL